MKTAMRKLILIVMILMLCGCGGEASSGGTRNELVKDYGFKMEEELKEYISTGFDIQQNYAMGNGIKVLSLDKGSDELQLFPVYCNDELIFLVLYGQETVYIDDRDVLGAITENDAYLILKAEENVYFVSKDKTLLLNGERKEFSDNMKKKIDKIRNGVIERNLMGIEKRAIRLVSDTDDQPDISGGDYRNDRITVRFTSEDTENKVRMYEAFCHGRQYLQLSENTFVFVFEPLNSKNLKILLDASNGLSYVLSASLDERNDNVEPVDGLETE